MRRKVVGPVLGFVFLQACATLPYGPSPSGLGQTDWTLIDIREPASSDPREVALNTYQMSFKGDGHASFIFDCNRGTASWRAVPSAPAKGNITFGPIAATRALCQDGGIGDRLAGDLTGTWPYEIYDGRLTITTAKAAYTFDSIA